jgi:AcrR family transcriptional regulator
MRKTSGAAVKPAEIIEHSHLGAPTERGQRTRRALANAALELMQEGRSFDSLSLREVTKRAGIVPAAFYRHFKDMEELGLAIVDECGRGLRGMLREVRQVGMPTEDIVRRSILIFKGYVEANPQYFRVAADRHGRSPMMREAVRHEVDRFIDEMVGDVTAMGTLDHLSPKTLRNVCDLVVNTMLNAAVEILDLAHEDPAIGQARIEVFVQQLLMVFVGAAAWQEPSPGDAA